MSREKNKTRPRALTFRQSSGEELIRVRVDSALKSVAESVCREHELTLPEVLRTVVRRIARDRRLPFEVEAPPPPDDALVPFGRDTPLLAGDLADLKAELALHLLATFIADRARRLAEGREQGTGDAKRLARWERELREAVMHHRTLDATDPALVDEVEARFRALLREST